jgi:hypothetical protein
VAFGVDDTWIILQSDGRLQCDAEVQTKYPSLTTELLQRRGLTDNDAKDVVSFVTDKTTKP